jgi:hypothetical protein
MEYEGFPRTYARTLLSSQYFHRCHAAACSELRMKVPNLKRPRRFDVLCSAPRRSNRSRACPKQDWGHNLLLRVLCNLRRDNFRLSSRLPSIARSDATSVWEKVSKPSYPLEPSLMGCRNRQALCMARRILRFPPANLTRSPTPNGPHLTPTRPPLARGSARMPAVKRASNGCPSPFAP